MPKTPSSPQSIIIQKNFDLQKKEREKESESQSDGEHLNSTQVEEINKFLKFQNLTKTKIKVQFPLCHIIFNLCVTITICVIEVAGTRPKRTKHTTTGARDKVEWTYI